MRIRTGGGETKSWSGEVMSEKENLGSGENLFLDKGYEGMVDGQG